MNRSASTSSTWALLALLPWGCTPQGSPGTPGQPPRLSKDVFDLGEVPHGRRVFAEYLLENPQDRVLAIRGVVVSCKCAYLELRRIDPDGRATSVDPGLRPEGQPITTIEPGGSLKALVRYETGETPPLRAVLNEPVTFFLDHPQVPRLDARLTGTILPRLRVQPALPQFSPIPESASGSILVDLMPLPGASGFAVTGFKGLSPKLRAEIVSSGEERIRLRFTAGPGLVPGPLVLPVQVLIDLEDGYQLPLLLKGQVVPNLGLEPPPPLPFGSIDPKSGAQSSALLSWRDPETDLEPRIQSIMGPPLVSARLLELQPGRLWRLELTYSPGELVQGPVSGHVILATACPRQPEFEIPFTGLVRTEP